jgi:hypothetical protein
LIDPNNRSSEPPDGIQEIEALDKSGGGMCDGIHVCRQTSVRNFGNLEFESKNCRIRRSALSLGNIYPESTRHKPKVEKALNTRRKSASIRQRIKTAIINRSV